jgi:fumarate hydratase subunit alpha
LRFEDVIENVAVRLLQLAATKLPKDVKEALKAAYCEEESEIGKTQLKAILENIELAEKTNTPMCQDTGLIAFYVKAGAYAKKLDKIEYILAKATSEATKKVPLRPNAVHPFTRRNTGDNVGRFVPHIHWEITSGKNIELTVFLKGGGSENVCALDMLTPGEGVKAMKKFVVDTVIEAGAKPCPPCILGVGIGGSADISMKMANTALLRPIDTLNTDTDIAKIEKELYEAVNMTGIGPMGLGGKSTALGVNIEYAYRHPASYPVAVVFQCWATRRASAKIHSDCTVEYLSHTVR